MKVFKQIEDLKAELARHRRYGKPIGLVPTMGFLHEGHLELVRKSHKDNIITVVSIFVNPTQFGPNEDFDRYPRDFVRDETLLAEENVDYLFYPSVAEMYPEGFSSSIHVSGVTEGLCGAKRPGHFDGVALVVTKLLNIVQPHKAYFGLKDYQQFQVINRLVKDLNIPVKIEGVPIIREHDGLAMSSRNVFLNHEDRSSALALYNSSKFIRKLIEKGVPAHEIKNRVIEFINSHPHVLVEYVEFVHPETLKSVTDLSSTSDNKFTEPFMCLIAAKVGETRLIDNFLFDSY